MLDGHTDLIDSFTIDTDYDSFTVEVSSPGDFPMTYQRKFRIKRGFKNMVALSAVKIDADDDIIDIDPIDRNCYFPEEVGTMRLHTNYSQSNCYLECSLLNAQMDLKLKYNLTQACTPWFFPFVDANQVVCNPWQSFEIFQLMQQNIAQGSCSYYLPDCSRIIYEHTLSAEPFRKCDEKNFGVSFLCNLDYRANIPKPQIWGSQVQIYIVNYAL